MLDQKTINDIVDHASASDLARHIWDGRGKAPPGYIKGLAVTFGLCLQKLAARDSAALAMVRIVDDGKDVFDHPKFEPRLRDVGILPSIHSNPALIEIDRLRALFVILAGLGMRESSGGYDIGQDGSAPGNRTAEKAEAGWFQQSWDSRAASPEIVKLFNQFKSAAPSIIDALCRDGVHPRDGAMQNYGDPPGSDFQAMLKAQPSIAIQCAALCLRTLCNHFGPINTGAAEVRPEADALFRQVQTIVGVKSSGAAGKPAAPSTGWLSTLLAMVMAFFRGTTTKPTPAPVPAATDLAGRIVAAMRKRGFRLDTGPGQMNTVYVEGMGPDGTKNDNEPNQFNDARFVIGFESGKPKIIGAWEATTEPGRYWTENPMNSAGAARIKFGQYTAWQVGMHHTHEALVQTGGNVTVYRDLNEDYKRDGDQEDTGAFGINQHWGYDLAKGDLGRSSAGCLVGRMKTGHQQFMALMKSDPRYVDNHRFVFTASVLPASEI